MKIVYPEIDFGLSSKLHPRHQDLKDDFVRWMVEEFHDEDVGKLEKYASQVMFWSRTYSNFEYSERLLWVNRLFALWFLIDDIQEERKTSIEDANSLYNDLLASIRNSEHQPAHLYVAAHMKVLAGMKAISPQAWFVRFKQGAYEFVYYNHLADTRNDENVPLANATFVRILSSAMPPAFALYEFLGDAYLTENVLLSPYFQSLDHLAAKIIAFYNDIVSFEKEVGQAQMYLIVPVLKRTLGSNTQTAIVELAQIVKDDMNAFRVQAAECVNLFDEEDAKNLQLYIGHLFTGIQGNKEYSDETDRYFRGGDIPCEAV